jgi:hypothetical protein
MAALAPRSWAVNDAAVRDAGPLPTPDASRRAAPAADDRHDTDAIALLAAIGVIILALTIALGNAPLG